MVQFISLYFQFLRIVFLFFFQGVIFFSFCQCYFSSISIFICLFRIYFKVFVKIVERNIFFEGIVDKLGYEFRVIGGYFCYNMERVYLNERKER